jgi:hypothetical protein
VINPGLTIRQRYKLAAIQGGNYPCDPGDYPDEDVMALWAGHVADAMIEEDNRHG